MTTHYKPSMRMGYFSFPGLDDPFIRNQVRLGSMVGYEYTMQETANIVILTINEAFGYDMTFEVLESPSRKREKVWSRFACFFWVNKMHDCTLKNIGAMFGGRDHSTIINGIREWQNKIDIYPHFEKVNKKIAARLKHKPE